jgi:hypothetical protein
MMAKVERKVVKIETLILELTQEEAEALKCMVGRVSGWNNGRDVTTAIFHALDEAGITAGDFKLKSNIEFDFPN